MRFGLRLWTTAFLLVVVTLASVQLAAARGQSPAVGTMVICTGTGPIHILVDENGKPTGAVMVCPDYALAFYASTSHTTPQATRADVWCALWTSAVDRTGVAQTTPASQARGPPIPV